MSYVQEAYAKVEARSAGEPEFLQAVKEVFQSLEPVFEKRPDLAQARILERLAEPERQIMFRVVWQDDEGNIHELGTNTFGLISTQSEEEIRELVSGLTQSATGKDPEITITTWEEWNSNRK